MKVPTASAIRHLEQQGYRCAGTTLAASARWLRFTPALSAALLGAAAALRSPRLCWVFSAVALAGAAGRHPFDLLFDRVVGPFVGRRRCPPTPSPGGSRCSWPRRSAGSRARCCRSGGRPAGSAPPPG